MSAGRGHKSRGGIKLLPRISENNQYKQISPYVNKTHEELEYCPDDPPIDREGSPCIVFREVVDLLSRLCWEGGAMDWTPRWDERD